MSSRYLVLHWSREGAELKIGIAARKSVGKAVTRNRLKRRLRESVRKLLSSLPQDLKMVIVGKKAAVGLSFEEIMGELQGLLRSAGLVENG